MRVAFICIRLFINYGWPGDCVDVPAGCQICFCGGIGCHGWVVLSPEADSALQHHSTPRVLRSPIR